MKPITYKDAGVDIDEGDRFVRLIAPIAKSTFRQGTLTDIGSFGALFQIDLNKYREPVLVSGTDGVGTKLKIAFMMDKHDTVGIDLVAMSVNDILTLGAEPLFFLDYLATGRLRPEKAAQIIKGIAEGCKDAGCSLIGGETAEMADFYAEGEYDLAGFAVGIVEKGSAVNGSAVQEGDALIGLASSGIHSNGYSLVRKVFFERNRWAIDRYVPELLTTIGEELLKPTAIYVKAIMRLMRDFHIKAMAHITGGGLPGNLIRVIPKGMTAEVKQGSWEIPPVFSLIQQSGNVPQEDMSRTFNMGIGFVIICAQEEVDEIRKTLSELETRHFLIGSIAKGEGGFRYV